MKAEKLICTRIIYSESAFAELVLWRVPKYLAGSLHNFKYRLAYVVCGECVLRYDNEIEQGDHRHFKGKESAYIFTTPEQLIADFQQDIISTFSGTAPNSQNFISEKKFSLVALIIDSSICMVCPLVC